MSFRQFDNPSSLPAKIITHRLRSLDSEVVVRLENHRREDSTAYQYVSVESSILTDAQIISLLIPITQAEIDAISHYVASIYNMELVTELKTITQAQAASYVEQRITNGVLEASALTAFDNAGTFAAAKPILRNMLIGMYRINSVLKLVARLLVATRDNIKPFWN